MSRYSRMNDLVQSGSRWGRKFSKSQPATRILGKPTKQWKLTMPRKSSRLGFNYQYLLDFLTTADEDQINLEFKDSESAAS